MTNQVSARSAADTSADRGYKFFHLFLWVLALLVTAVGCGGEADDERDPPRKMKMPAIDKLRQSRWQRLGAADVWQGAIAVAPDGTVWYGTHKGGAVGLTPQGESLKLAPPQIAARHVRAIAAAPDGSVWIGTVLGVTRRAPDGTFETFRVEDGLASNLVVAIALAPDGSVWFGTADKGVSQRASDGAWQTFSAEDGLADDRVRSGALAAMPDGSLWVGTAEGLSRRAANGTWRRYTTDDGLIHNEVNAIVRAADGSIWFGTQGGVSRLVPDGSWQSFTTEDSLPRDQVATIAAAPDGSVWLGYMRSVGLTSAERSLKLAPAGHTRRYLGDAVGATLRSTDGSWRTFTEADGLPGDHVTAIAAAPDGTVWFGSLGNGARFLAASHPCRRILPQDDLNMPAEIRVMALGPDGSLWFATLKGVLRLCPDGSFREFTTENGLPGNKVRDIAISSEGAVWLIVIDHGLVRIGADGSIQNVTESTGSPVWEVEELVTGPDEAVWMATRKGLRLARSDGALVAAERFGEEQCGLLAPGSDGSLWMVSVKGIHGRSVDGEWTDHEWKEDYGKTFREPCVLAVAPEGTLWLGGYEGLLRIEVDGRWHKVTDDKMGRDSELLALEDGSVWFTDRSERLHRVDRDGVRKTFGVMDGFPHEDVNTFLQLPDGSLLIATNRGLCRYVR